MSTAYENKLHERTVTNYAKQPILSSSARNEKAQNISIQNQSTTRKKAYTKADHFQQTTTRPLL